MNFRGNRLYIFMKAGGSKVYIILYYKSVEACTSGSG